MGQSGNIYRSAGSTVPLRVKLTSNNVDIDLTGATVKFFLSDTQYWTGQQFQPPLSGTFHDIAHLKVDAGSCAADADTTNFPVTEGWIVWSPAASDVDTPGAYYYQFKVVYADATIEYFPEIFTDVTLTLGPVLDAL